MIAFFYIMPQRAISLAIFVTDTAWGLEPGDKVMHFWLSEGSSVLITALLTHLTIHVVIHKYQADVFF